MKQAVLFWSGGKDSAMALYKARQDPDIHVNTLVTTLNTEFKRISMHGIREELLDRQATETGIPLCKMWVPNEPTNTSYEKVLIDTYNQLKDEGIDTVIFGDIFLEDLRWYREQLLKKCGLAGYFPLWQQPTDHLLKDFISLEFHTITCCINTEYLDEEWLGREVDQQFVDDLPLIVDPCGENGEFHTFCYAGPVFNKPVSFHTGEKRYHPLQVKTSFDNVKTGFWYIDLV